PGARFPGRSYAGAAVRVWNSASTSQKAASTCPSSGSSGPRSSHFATSERNPPRDALNNVSRQWPPSVRIQSGPASRRSQAEMVAERSMDPATPPRSERRAGAAREPWLAQGGISRSGSEGGHDPLHEAVEQRDGEGRVAALRAVDHAFLDQ